MKWLVGAVTAAILFFASRPTRATPSLRALFDRYIWPIDFALFDAIAVIESNRDPSNVTNVHRGIWQLGPENVMDYNTTHRANFPVTVLHDVEKSFPILVWHAWQIHDALREAGLRRSHPQYAGFFYAAHNAGWSRTAGLACALREAKEAGERIESLTLDDIPEIAKLCSHSSPFLKMPERLIVWKKLQALYDRTRET